VIFRENIATMVHRISSTLLREWSMQDSDLDRRRFHQLTLAAFSGVLAGTAAGCNNGGDAPADKPATGTNPPNAGDAPKLALTDEQVKLLTDEIHACRGLNACKGKGRSKENACAGQGTCASVADHDCGTLNECATQGGCGATAGINECKGKGGCHVPLMAGAWQQARSAFEVAMQKVGKDVGAAPKPAKP
jgi:hypothetical protein